MNPDELEKSKENLLSAEEKTKQYKEQLKIARGHLLNAQTIVRPFDERFAKINKIIERLEEMIMLRSNL